MSKRVNSPELRFKEFSGEWEEKKLGEIIILMQSGLSRLLSNNDIGIPVIRSNNLINGKIDTKDIKYWYKNDTQGADNSNYFLQDNDILVNFINSIAQIGKVALYKNTLNRNVIFTTNLMRLQFKDIVDFTYIFYFFNTTRYKNYIYSITKPAVNQASFTTKDFNMLIVPLPKKQEQQKIASFLTTIDTKIEQFSKKVELQEQYKKGVMQKIFSQEIRFKKDDRNYFSEWEEMQLKDFLILTLREVSKPKENYLAIGVRSHCKGTFQKPNSEPHKIAMDKLYKVKEHDLIVSITFAWESAIAIVKKSDEGGLVSHRFPTYTFKKDKVIVEFFKYVIFQKKFRFMLDLISPGGAGRNRVMSKKDFLKLKWILPPIEEQTKIANFLSTLDEQIDSTKKQLAKIKEFKKGLLQRMFV